MAKRLDNKTFQFAEQKIEDSPDFSVRRFGGNHWDDIFYFPKNYQIGFVEAGKGTFMVGQQTVEVQQGDTYFIKPDLVHKGKPDATTGWQISEIKIHPKLIEIGEHADTDFSIFKHFKPTAVSTERTALLTHFKADVAFEEALALVYDFLLDVSDADDSTPTSDVQHAAVIRAKAFIEAHYKDKFSLDDLAKAAYLSKFHLLRVFKHEIGLAPYTYQLQLKLNEARKLIFQKKSLTEVAYELGFNDQAHFIHAYKQFADRTPGDFLRTAIFYNSED